MPPIVTRVGDLPALAGQDMSAIAACLADRNETSPSIAWRIRLWRCRYIDGELFDYAERLEQRVTFLYKCRTF